MCEKNELNIVTNEVVKEAKTLLGENLSSVILFGSYARGDYDDESDIDVMIIADLNKNEFEKIEKELLDFSCDIDLKYDVVLSLILQEKSTFEKYKETYPLYKIVAEEGVDLVA